MSQSLQNQMTLAKSMNSIITLDDGAGTTITNGTINSNDIFGNTISANTFSTNDLDLNASLTLEVYNDISITNTGGTYDVSLWEKGKSYLQQDVHMNKAYSYNTATTGYEVANKNYVDSFIPIRATYSTGVFLPGTNPPTLIKLDYVDDYFAILLPPIISRQIGDSFTFYLGKPLLDDQVISIGGRLEANQFIQTRNNTIQWLVDFTRYGANSMTFVAIRTTTSTTEPCWMISNINYEYENVFLNRRRANSPYQDNYTENTWKNLNTFSRDGGGTALSVALGSVMELDGNLYTGGRTLTPEDLAYPASSRQKITIIGNSNYNTLTFLDAGVCLIDDSLPSPPTQVYLPELTATNDIGKSFSFGVRYGTNQAFTVYTFSGQSFTYLNQTGLTSIEFNAPDIYNIQFSFLAITEFGAENWLLTQKQTDLALSDTIYSGHNYYAGQVDFQNTITANSLTISPQQLSFLNQVNISNQIPSTAIDGYGTGFLSETSDSTITGIYTFSTNPILNTAALPITVLNGSINLTRNNTTSTFSAVKTFTSNPVFNTGGIALASISGSANITLNNTTSTISAVKTFTSNPVFNTNAIPVTSLQDSGTRYPTFVRKITYFGYLAANQIATTITTATNVVAIGDGALQNLSSGQYTTAVGSGAGNGHDAGNFCSYFGYNAGAANTGSEATIIGSNTCTSQTSIPGATVVGFNSNVTDGTVNSFSFGINNSVTASGGGAIGNGITNNTANRIHIGLGVNEVFVGGTLNVNNQIINDVSPTVITANTTIPNTDNYAIYSIRNAAGLTITLPTLTSGRIGQSFLFRRVKGSALASGIVFNCGTAGNLIYAANSVTGSSTTNLIANVTSISFVCLSDGQASPEIGWYVT